MAYRARLYSTGRTFPSHFPHSCHVDVFVRQVGHTEHRERPIMNRKGFRKVSQAQARQQTVTTLQHLRDESIRMAKESLAEGAWRVALTCLGKAALYDDRATATEDMRDTPK
ncbi:MAG TPA: hypothetical protein VKZ50_21810 [bacterium]|nr:hypothetical protein [bacterium]